MSKTYIALLRGINVGGKGKVSMQALKTCFEEMGLKAVKTYINSGNVIFISENTDTKKLAVEIEESLHATFNFPINVVVKNLAEIKTVVSAIPKSWHGNKEFRHYIMFLMPDVDLPETINQLKVNPDMEEVSYVPGAILWSAKIAELGHSNMSKMIGSKLYKQMTIRNLNTTLKVYELMLQAKL